MSAAYLSAVGVELTDAEELYVQPLDSELLELNDIGRPVWKDSKYIKNTSWTFDKHIAKTKRGEKRTHTKPDKWT